MYTKTAKALRVFGGLYVSRLSEGLKDSNSDASGKLDSSISFKVTSKKNKIETDILMEDYYEFVDEGRPAGKPPPITDIEQWLAYPNVKSKLQLEELDGEGRLGLAYAIAGKIGSKGTKGNKFFTNVVNSKLVTRDLPNLIVDAMIEDTELILDDFFSSLD